MQNVERILTSIEGPWILQTSDLSPFRDMKNIILLEGKKMTTLRGVFDEFAKKFKFPDYFGGNYDALFEMLNDLEWFPQDFYIVLIEDFDKIFFDVEYNEINTILSILLEASEEWSQPIELGEWWDRPAIPFHTIIEVKGGVPISEELKSQIQILSE